MGRRYGAPSNDRACRGHAPRREIIKNIVHEFGGHMKSILLAFVLLAACNPMTWHQDDPSKTYKQTVPTASRLSEHSAACDTIGTLTFDDGRIITDDDVVTIAEKAASVGGTSYLIRNASTTTRRGKTKLTTGVVEVLVCTSGIRED